MGSRGYRATCRGCGRSRGRYADAQVRLCLSARTRGETMSNRVRVLVTGGRGFFGLYIVEELHRRGYEYVHSVGRADCDLVHPGAVDELFRRIRPTHVIHAAAAVGGIGANVAQAGWFSYANTMMAANIVEACRAHGAGKLLSIGTVCVYPQAAPVPTPESAMFDGFPAADTAACGIAKRNLWMMGAAYRKQYGLNAVFLIPTNPYGPRD